jgi:hypothetical protein
MPADRCSGAAGTGQAVQYPDAPGRPSLEMAPVRYGQGGVARLTKPCPHRDNARWLYQFAPDFGQILREQIVSTPEIEKLSQITVL